MAFDPLVANDGRLRILAALAGEDGLEFVRLRQVTELTDGNLSAHAKRLQSGGLVAIQKQFREGKPVTTIHLTDDGRQRLTAHVQALVAALGVCPRGRYQPWWGPMWGRIGKKIGLIDLHVSLGWDGV
jgi:DNA-binding transcriptional ArsR family regulator